jgi:transcriptional regulator of heat shock response
MSKTLPPRTEAILKSIVEQYIARAAPVPPAPEAAAVPR